MMASAISNNTTINVQQVFARILDKVIHCFFLGRYMIRVSCKPADRTNFLRYLANPFEGHLPLFGARKLSAT